MAFGQQGQQCGKLTSFGISDYSTAGPRTGLRPRLASSEQALAAFPDCSIAFLAKQESEYSRGEGGCCDVHGEVVGATLQVRRRRASRCSSGRTHSPQDLAPFEQVFGYVAAKKRPKGLGCGVAGGSGEIRTHGGVSPTAVFKTAALNHSATLPDTRPSKATQFHSAAPATRIASGGGGDLRRDSAAVPADPAVTAGVGPDRRWLRARLALRPASAVGLDLRVALRPVSTVAAPSLITLKGTTDGREERLDRRCLSGAGAGRGAAFVPRSRLRSHRPRRPAGTFVMIGNFPVRPRSESP